MRSGSGRASTSLFDEDGTAGSSFSSAIVQTLGKEDTNRKRSEQIHQGTKAPLTGSTYARTSFSGPGNGPRYVQESPVNLPSSQRHMGGVRQRTALTELQDARERALRAKAQAMFQVDLEAAKEREEEDMRNRLHVAQKLRREAGWVSFLPVFAKFCRTSGDVDPDAVARWFFQQAVLAEKAASKDGKGGDLCRCFQLAKRSMGSGSLSWTAYDFLAALRPGPVAEDCLALCRDAAAFPWGSKGGRSSLCAFSSNRTAGSEETNFTLTGYMKGVLGAMFLTLAVVNGTATLPPSQENAAFSQIDFEFERDVAGPYMEQVKQVNVAGPYMEHLEQVKQNDVKQSFSQYLTAASDQGSNFNSNLNGSGQVLTDEKFVTSDLVESMFSVVTDHLEQNIIKELNGSPAFKEDNIELVAGPDFQNDLREQLFREMFQEMGGGGGDTENTDDAFRELIVKKTDGWLPYFGKGAMQAAMTNEVRGTVTKVWSRGLSAFRALAKQFPSRFATAISTYSSASRSASATTLKDVAKQKNLEQETMESKMKEKRDRISTAAQKNRKDGNLLQLPETSKDGKKMSASTVVSTALKNDRYKTYLTSDDFQKLNSILSNQDGGDDVLETNLDIIRILTRIMASSNQEYEEDRSKGYVKLLQTSTLLTRAMDSISNTAAWAKENADRQEESQAVEDVYHGYDDLRNDGNSPVSHFNMVQSQETEQIMNSKDFRQLETVRKVRSGMYEAFESYQKNVQEATGTLDNQKKAINGRDDMTPNEKQLAIKMLEDGTVETAQLAVQTRQIKNLKSQLAQKQQLINEEQAGRRMLQQRYDEMSQELESINPSLKTANDEVTKATLAENIAQQEVEQLKQLQVRLQKESNASPKQKADAEQKLEEAGKNLTAKKTATRKAKDKVSQLTALQKKLETEIGTLNSDITELKNKKQELTDSNTRLKGYIGVGGAIIAALGVFSCFQRRKRNQSEPSSVASIATESGEERSRERSPEEFLKLLRLRSYKTDSDDESSKHLMDKFFGPSKKSKLRQLALSLWEKVEDGYFSTLVLLDVSADSNSNFRNRCSSIFKVIFGEEQWQISLSNVEDNNVNVLQSNLAKWLILWYTWLETKFPNASTDDIENNTDIKISSDEFEQLKANAHEKWENDFKEQAAQLEELAGASLQTMGNYFTLENFPVKFQHDITETLLDQTTMEVRPEVASKALSILRNAKQKSFSALRVPKRQDFGHDQVAYEDMYNLVSFLQTDAAKLLLFLEQQQGFERDWPFSVQKTEWMERVCQRYLSRVLLFISFVSTGDTERIETILNFMVQQMKRQLENPDQDLNVVIGFRKMTQNEMEREQNKESWKEPQKLGPQFLSNPSSSSSSSSTGAGTKFSVLAGNAIDASKVNGIATMLLEADEKTKDVKFTSATEKDLLIEHMKNDLIPALLKTRTSDGSKLDPSKIKQKIRSTKNTDDGWIVAMVNTTGDDGQKELISKNYYTFLQYAVLQSILASEKTEDKNNLNELYTMISSDTATFEEINTVLFHHLIVSSSGPLNEKVQNLINRITNYDADPVSNPAPTAMEIADAYEAVCQKSNDLLTKYNEIQQNVLQKKDIEGLKQNVDLVKQKLDETDEEKKLPTYKEVKTLIETSLPAASSSGTPVTSSAAVGSLSSSDTTALVSYLRTTNAIAMKVMQALSKCVHTRAMRLDPLRGLGDGSATGAGLLPQDPFLLQLQAAFSSRSQIAHFDFLRLPGVTKGSTVHKWLETQRDHLPPALLAKTVASIAEAATSGQWAPLSSTSQEDDLHGPDSWQKYEGPFGMDISAAKRDREERSSRLRQEFALQLLTALSSSM